MKRDINKKAEEFLQAVFDIHEDTLENVMYYKRMFDKYNKYKIIIGDLPNNFSTSLILDSIYCTDLEEMVHIVKKVC
nr:MAG: hypothetical protein [Bacteriophage sp.]